MSHILYIKGSLFNLLEISKPNYICIRKLLDSLQLMKSQPNVLANNLIRPSGARRKRFRPQIGTASNKNAEVAITYNSAVIFKNLCIFSALKPSII